MENTGKRFEKAFRSSVPKRPTTFLYRLRDTATTYYGGNDNLRFSGTNMCDFIMFDCTDGKGKLILLELKATKGKSLPLGNIKQHQIDEMLKCTNYDNVYPFFLVFFSDVGRCFALDVYVLSNFIQKGERKSIPIAFLEEYGEEIDCTLVRTNYKYDIEKWLK